MNTHFIEPLDVLFLRGNRLFGEPGSYGESMIPPWPSVAAGAIRAAILARDYDERDIAAFKAGRKPHGTLGTPVEPGGFRLIDFQLAWHGDSGKGALERLYPLPADLVASTDTRHEIVLHALRPLTPDSGIESSIPTRDLPVMAQHQRIKPATGLWLNARGMEEWLSGRMPDPKAHLVASQRLWSVDERVGIGLHRETRRADDGKLFTAQAVAMKDGVGFLVTVVEDSLADGTIVRFGGDGRGAVVRDTQEAPLPAGDLEAIARSGRCRLILTAPGIFPLGWLPAGCKPDRCFDLLGVRGRVVCAAVPRAEVISGWDLARWRPKPAHRAAPAGTVYWIEALEATPEQLRKLVDHGLWPESGYDASRRVEGFNRCTIASY